MSTTLPKDTETRSTYGFIFAPELGQEWDPQKGTELCIYVAKVRPNFNRRLKVRKVRLKVLYLRRI